MYQFEFKLFLLLNLYISCLCETSKYPDLVFPENRNVKTRITSGQNAADHAYPYQVGFYVKRSDGNYYFCGGSLISSNYVLTAAHCLDDEALYAEVFVGVNEIPAPSTNGSIVADKFILHDGWADEYENDVALINLPQHVTLNSYAKLINLDDSSDDHTGKTAVASGWGKTEYTFSIVTQLKYVESDIISNDDCKNAHTALAEVVKDSHVCISGKDGKGTCTGDSGGPLVIDGTQVGIVSFGLSDCINSPSVFTRVNKYKEWIEDKCSGCTVEQQETPIEVPKANDDDNSAAHISISFSYLFIVLCYFIF